MTTALAFDIIGRDRASKSFTSVGNSASDAEKKVAQFKDVGRKLAAGLAIAGTAAVVAGASVVKSASNAQQSLGATETVFGKYAKAVVRDSNRAATQFGLSANEYRENANLIGALLKNQGVSLDQLGGKTKNMIGTASDLAATFGGTTKEAVEALGSAFKGEFDPLEKYGISLKASTVSTEAMRLANVKSATEFGKLSVAQQTAYKQQATSALIAKQSADSQGAFARETDTLAHQQQVLGAQFENVKAKLGSALLPVVTQFAAFLTSSVMPAVSGFVNGMKTGTGAGGKLAAALGVLRDNAKTVAVVVGASLAVWAGYKTALVAAKTWQTTVMVATKAYTAAQWLLNAALNANPLGLIITGLALVAGGLVLAYKKSETFRNVVDGALRAVGKAFDWLKDKATSAIDFVVGIPGDIKAAFSGAKDWLLGIGKDIIQGLIDGITDKLGDLKAKLSSVTDLIPDWKGPLSRDRVLLKPTGQAIMDGLIGGIASRQGALRSTLEMTTATILAATSKLSSTFGQRLQELLDKQRDALRATRDKFNEFADFRSVFMPNLFGVDVSGANGPGGVAALLAYSQQQRATAEQLRSDIAALTGRGISSELLEQLRSQGASGVDAIHALATANPEDYAAIIANLQAAGLIYNQAGLQAAQNTSIPQLLASLTASQAETSRALKDLANQDLTITLIAPDGKATTKSLRVYRRSLGNVPLGFD